MYLFVLLLLLAWPVGLLFSSAEGYEREFRESYYRFSNETHYWVMAVSVILAGLGLWLSILAAFILKARRLLHVLFRPFAEKMRPKWAIRLLLIGLALMILSAGTGIVYYKYFIRVWSDVAFLRGG